MSRNIAIIGDGGWGTALGLLLHRQGHRPRIWGPFPDYIQRIREWRENKLYLPGIPLPPELVWTANREEVLAGAEVIILAVPSRFFSAVVAGFAGLVPPGCTVVSATKGLDPDSLRRMTEVVQALLKVETVAALSGPSFASEVAAGAPTAVVVACTDPDRARSLQNLFNSAQFRVYTSDDVVGVELGGVLKNVIAIAVGVSDGLNFGHNARAALITRGLAEMTRLGCALGANSATFAGLSGLGDLVLTCTSRLSRNHTVGERLGQGERLEDILAGMQQVAEGVGNCVAARALARRHGVAVPITEEVYSVIYENKPPRAAVEALMRRDPRPERDEKQG